MCLEFRRRGQSGELLVEEAVDEGGAKAAEEWLGDIVVFIMAAQLAKEVQVRQL